MDAYRIPDLCRMFLGLLEHSAHEELRHTFELIEQDRTHHRIDDDELRSRVEHGTYGEDARSLWEHFRRTGGDAP
jgi:hypothetical protein